MSVRRHLLVSALATIASLAAAPHALAQSGAPIKVGTDPTFPPMEFIENGKRTGFDVELVEALGKAMGRPIEWIDIDFKGLVPGLVSRRFDMAVSAIYITDERKKVVDFTQPYYAGGLVIMVKDGHTSIAKPADLAGKRVSVQVGTKSVHFLKDNYPQARLVEVEKNQEMFNLVDIGRADAAVTGKPAAFQYARTKGGLKVLPDQLTTEEYGIAVRKDLPELTKGLDDALVKIKADGTYEKIVNKWFPSK